VRINERIRINGEAISDDGFALIHDLVEHTAERLVEEKELPWHPSFFEMLTAMAFEHFSREKVDIAVLEVGMGGRLDATNVVDPLVSVITDISLDHQKFLGNTITEIAREKVGIIRPRGAVVTLPQLPEANDVIGNAILDREARAISAVAYVPPVSPGSPTYFNHGRSGDDSHKRCQPEERSDAESARSSPAIRPLSRYPLLVMGKQILIETPLLGRHQLRNIALAIATAEELEKHGFPITAESIERGIRETRWAGRFQLVPRTPDSPEMVLDVAHNPAGAWALRSTLSGCYEDRPLTFLFGAMRDKAIGEIAEILFPLADRVVVTKAENPRSATPEEIRAAAARISTEMIEAENVPTALAKTKAMTPAGGVIVITGSIYVVGEAMRELGLSI
jgi:dihydrofolate synthase/folylpolyglutamate synthase